MIASETVDTIPLAMNNDGVIRVSSTRVTLDSIVTSFQNGATAEEIAQQYPTVPLGDIYQVIGYALRHREEVEAYLLRRRQEAQVMKAENEQRWSPNGVRDRLLARRLK